MRASAIFKELLWCINISFKRTEFQYQIFTLIYTLCESRVIHIVRHHKNNMTLQTKLILNRWATYLVPSYPLHLCKKYTLSIVSALFTIGSAVAIMIFRAEIAELTLGSLTGLKWLAIFTIGYLILLEPWIWLVRSWIIKSEHAGHITENTLMRGILNSGHILSIGTTFAAAFVFLSALRSDFRVTYSTHKDMQPSIMPGQKFVMKYYRGEVYAVNDIIAFLDPASGKRILIKRLVGLPGDEVSLIDGFFENTNKLRHQYLPPEQSKKIERFGPIILKDDCYMVLGDIVLQSQADSLTFGCVPRKNLFGKVLYNLDGTIPAPLTNEMR